MPIILTTGEVLQALGEHARYAGEPGVLTRRALKISTDSRLCGPEDLFFALRGERFDGHDFIAEIFSRGALAAVVEAGWFGSEKKRAGNFLVVEDTLTALQDLGRVIRRRWGQLVLAITGSTGKTTTKEMVAAVLAQKIFVHKTSGNLNNHIGVPLVLSELTHAHELAVLEMGTNHFGEIAALCKIAAPDFGLITNIGRAHTEFFGDLTGVAKAKRELWEAVRARDGIAFLNADDAHLIAALPSGMKAVTYGLQAPAQIHGKIAGMDDEGRVTLAWKDEQIRLNVAGQHQASNALAAIAVGDYFGVTPGAIKKGLETFTVPEKRMQISQLAGMTVINDAYNANPESLRAALEFLASRQLAEGGRRIAILGDMLELGAAAETAHHEAGEVISTLPVQAVFAFGPNMKYLVHAVGQHCWALHFENKHQLIEEIKRSVRPGDVLLIKGSRGMAMEEVIKQL